jgi:hypothetical protein
MVFKILSHLKIPEKYQIHFNEAKDYEIKVMNGKRWGGDPLLIIIDSALVSSGLNYFKIILPKIKSFKAEFIDKNLVVNLEDLAIMKADHPSLLSIFKYRRVWSVAIQLAQNFTKMINKRELKEPIEVIRDWAALADHKKWEEDVIGKIKGVGLITFQYLRMQVGIDTCMPDRIIKKYVNIYFGLDTKDNLLFIKKFKELCNDLNVSQIFLSWLIWLAESDKIKK